MSIIEHRRSLSTQGSGKREAATTASRKQRTQRHSSNKRHSKYDKTKRFHEGVVAWQREKCEGRASNGQYAANQPSSESPNSERWTHTKCSVTNEQDVKHTKFPEKQDSCWGTVAIEQAWLGKVRKCGRTLPESMCAEMPILRSLLMSSRVDIQRMAVPLAAAGHQGRRSAGRANLLSI